jgi:hypothetical protein
MSKAETWLNGIEGLTIGTSYPYYSKLSLSSLSVNGLSVEWNPGKFYLSTVYGQSSRMTMDTTFIRPLLTLAQNTFAAKIGYGARQGDHIHLVFADIHDRDHAESEMEQVYPQKNRLLGLDAFGGIYGRAG